MSESFSVGVYALPNESTIKELVRLGGRLRRRDA